MVVWHLIAMLAGVLAWFVQGWVLQSYWTWFVFPTFGIVAPGVMMCVGLSMTINLFTLKFDWDNAIVMARIKKEQESAEDEESKQFMIGLRPWLSIFVYLIGWVVGWLIHLMC